jgi:hypothetical protein
LHTLHTKSITGTSTNTPTTVASAAGESAPNNVIATAQGQQYPDAVLVRQGLGHGHEFAHRHALYFVN